MARIFTTKFVFNHQPYDAIVTIISNEGKLSFIIKLMDVELHDLIPQGQIQYNGADGFKNIRAENHLTQALIRSIAQSVERHLVSQ
jgi:hypothetical protein